MSELARQLSHRAAVGGQHENVTLLLETDPECALAKDLNGDTALHIACRNTGNNRHRKTVEALLVSGHSFVPILS